MEDIDILKHAQVYIEKMARGVNPLTDEEVPESDLVKNVRIGKCLEYVNGKLKTLIAAGGKSGGQRREKAPFVYDQSKMADVQYEAEGISLTELLRRVRVASGEDCALTYKMVAPLLAEKGILVESTEEEGKLVASPAAAANGIWSEKVNGQRGAYTRTLYDARGQRYVVDLLQVFRKEE